MRTGELHQADFALGPAVEALPDADSLLEAALPWIAGLCFTAAVLLAGGDEPLCKAGGKAERSAAAATLAPILANGRLAAAPGDEHSVAIRPHTACP